jgi:hypothetical protein
MRALDGPIMRWWVRLFGAHPRNFEENRGLQLLLVEPVADEIADADDPDNFAVIDNRKVTDFASRHRGEGGIDPLVRVAGDDG